MVKHLEKENFEEVIAHGLWLVDFYADWCGPCKMLAPILESIDANILKVNVDEHEDLAQKFGVMSIPTLIYFKEGQEVQKEIGLRSKDEILATLQSLN